MIDNNKIDDMDVKLREALIGSEETFMWQWKSGIHVSLLVNHYQFN